MIYRHKIPTRIFEILKLHIRAFHLADKAGVKDALTNNYYPVLVNLAEEDFWLENEIVFATKYFLGNFRFEQSDNEAEKQVYKESVEFLTFVGGYFEIVAHEGNVLLIPKGQI